MQIKFVFLLTYLYLCAQINVSMQKKDIVVNAILAVLLVVLVVICVRSVLHEMQVEDKRNQIEHARKQ